MDVMWMNKMIDLTAGCDFFVGLKYLCFSMVCLFVLGFVCGVGPTFAEDQRKQNLPELMIETYCCMILR